MWRSNIVGTILKLLVIYFKLKPIAPEFALVFFFQSFSHGYMFFYLIIPFPQPKISTAHFKVNWYTVQGKSPVQDFTLCQNTAGMLQTIWPQQYMLSLSLDVFLHYVKFISIFYQSVLDISNHCYFKLFSLPQRVQNGVVQL